MSVDSAPFSPLAEPQSGRYQPETPFLDTLVDETEGGQEWFEAPLATLATPVETPFLTEYDGELPAVDQRRQVHVGVMEQLFDAEFDLAVAELAQEAAAVHAEQRAQVGADTGDTRLAERMLDEWLDPLRRRADELLDEMGAVAAHADPRTLTEHAVDQLFETVDPAPAGANPAFEGFLKGLWDKAKKIAKGAVDLAKKGVAAVGRILPIGQILQRLKGLVRPLLERVLRFALDKVPAPLRPLATKLAGSLGLQAKEVEDLSTTTPDTTDIQTEFDDRVAQLLLAAEDAEQEMVLAEAAAVDPEEESTALPDLDRARERFIGEVQRLQPGQDPTPALEQFIPAVIALLPFVRMGIGLIGRQRVVGFLAGFLAPLIQKFVGAPAAKTLSQAIVDTGLGLLSLESPDSVVPRPADTPRLAGAALATTVEETVRQVAQLGDQALADPVQTEAAARSAFNHAVARNFPPRLLRPDLPESETDRGGGTWVMMPHPSRPPFHYKKYTRVFEVTLTPQAARTVRTFGGATLDQVLRDTGVSLPAPVRVHLYEAIPGTWLSRIARLERGVRGLGRAVPGAWKSLHPLTPEVAGLLVQQPGLGKPVPPRNTADRDRIAVGQRFFFLEFGSAGAPVVPGRTCTRSSEVNLTVDVRPGRNEIRAALYLSEREAQGIARRLDAKDYAGALGAVTPMVGTAVRSALRGDGGRHVVVLRETVPQEQWLAPVLKRIGEAVLDLVVEKVLEWLASALSSYFQRKVEEYLTATRDPACGVTVTVSIPGSPVATLLRDALGGRVTTLEQARSLLAAATVVPTVTTRPGFSRD